MIGKIISVVAATVLIVGASLPAAAGDTYEEWSTTQPFSGFKGTTSRKSFCDYIRYPKRRCSNNRYGKRVCKVVGWDVRQACY